MWKNKLRVIMEMKRAGLGLLPELINAYDAAPDYWTTEFAVELALNSLARLEGR